MGDTSAVSGAVKSIASALITEAKYLYGVEDEVRALQGDLECMKQFLQDVDANPNLLKQHGQLCILAHKMRELAFEAEDAIDNYLVDVGSKAYNKNFLLKFARIASQPYQIHMLRTEVETIQQEIKTVMTRSENFRAIISTINHSEGACAGSSYSKPVAENYIHLDEFVVGIEDDISRLVKRLSDPQDDFHVLGIVGTGGAGKTTLATQIYRHTKVQSSFSHRAFVSVSQQWSRLDLLHRISKEILGRSETSSSERELVRELHEFMKDKWCLVVLDDIWKKEAWDDVYPIFPRSSGLRIILTTRIEEVPLYADPKCVLHEPHMLTNDQMWELFSKGAVEGRHGIENNTEFEKLGKLMLQKCHGLPLAVVTLAGILRTKQHLYEWERVSVALSGKILEGKGGSTYGVVEEMIALSFLDLPAQMKPLFLYLAIFPEDSEWSSEELIEMWIAEGFVADDQIGRCETLEDKGMQFISELAQRYIIRVKKRNRRDEVELFSLHDIMREVCIKEASKCQFLDHISPACSYGNRSNKPRRVSIFSRVEHCLEENNYLRTIMYNCLSTCWTYPGLYGELRKLESIHEHFKLLRVLRIGPCPNKTLPKQIGSLIHLTYLYLVNTCIMELPESVRNLRNLIYLEYHPFCIGITPKVPDNLVVNMENLRVLVLPFEVQKHAFSKCKRLGFSERQKKLHMFKCSAGKWMIKDLPAIQQLLTLRVLQITNIEGIEQRKAIHQCMGFLRGSLQTIKLSFIAEGVSKELKFDTETLVSCLSLHDLHLHGRLVNNCTIQFPPNLVTLYLHGSEIGEEVDLMGVLGQLCNLRYLSLWTESYLGTELCCMGGSFPQLEELKLYNLKNLEEWRVEVGAMNRLNKIQIFICQKLKRLPRGIRSINTLKELYIMNMPTEFCKRLGYKLEGNAFFLRTQGGEDSDIVQHIPSVKLRLIADNMVTERIDRFTESAVTRIMQEFETKRTPRLLTQL